MTKVIYNSIFIIIERLIKYFIYILYKESNTIKELAFTFLKEIIANHGVLKEIISDRDKLFISKF